MILASNSPRRREILKDMGFKFKIIVPNIDESSNKEKIEEKVLEIAYKKAMEVAKENVNDFVLAADTVVELDNQILGKPKDILEARDYLTRLSGRKHRVVTAYSFVNVSKKVYVSDVVTCEVEFYELKTDEIEWYLSTGEAFDKAGAYAIQGKARIFIKEIKGDYFAIVGFPIARFMKKLQDLNYSIDDIQKI